DVAGEDDVRDADGGAGLRLPERHDAGEHRSEHGRPSDLERLAGDIARGDAALGDDEPRRGDREYALDEFDDTAGDAPSDVEALLSIDAGDQLARGVHDDGSCRERFSDGIRLRGEVSLASIVDEL